MSRSSGHTVCLKHSFDLGSGTVVLDWKKVRRDTLGQGDLLATSNSSSSTGKGKGPVQPGKGAAKFASTVQNLEARYAGKQESIEYGYERDGFVVSDDEDTTVLDESTDVTPEDFFVTQQPTERRKRPHSELPPDADMSAGEIARKRKKLSEEMSNLTPEVRESLMAFMETWTAFVGGRTLARFPPEMDAAIQTVGQVAMAHHPKGHLSNEIVEIITEMTGFSGPTLKPRLRKGHEGAGDNKASSASYHEAVAFLQQSGPEFVAALELQPEEARNKELQTLMERDIEELSKIVKAFTASFNEPPKRSPWNEPIRAKVRLLFAINDSIVPSPISAATLRTHIQSLWPPEWDVKDTQIKPLTRYATPKTKPSDVPGGSGH